MIPRILHWVWLGPHELPERDREWMMGWRKHHPHWKLLIWAESPEKCVLQGFETHLLPPLVNQRFYDGIEQWVTGKAVLASRSDIVRYEVVVRHGGIYVDTDVECFANIDSVLENVRLCVADEWGPCPGNFLFGGIPNHPALWTVVRELGPHLHGLGKAVGALDATGPRYLAPRMRAYQDAVIFPHMLFNPLCAFDDPDQVTRWPQVSLGNHRYDGKWYDRTKNPPPPEFRHEEGG